MTPRPKQHLIDIGRRYPGAWRQVDTIRQGRGDDLPDWPDWCFMPLAGAYAIVSSVNRTPSLAIEVGRVGAMAAWRLTQGIYRFDPALYERVAETPVDRDIPCDVLYHLPEWCVYIETPGLTYAGQPLHGFFAHLEYDVNNGRHELRLVLDTELMLIPLPLHLGKWPLAEALNRALDEGMRHSIMTGMTQAAGNLQSVRSDPELMARLLDELEHVISLLLFICSQPDELGEPGRRPVNPEPKRTKKGWRLFAADKATTWDVGVRIGAALRRACQQVETGSRETDPDSGRARPRAHVRRAHWHTFVSGPRLDRGGRPIPAEDRKRDIRWVPPIPVNVGDPDDLPAVVRKVK